MTQLPTAEDILNSIEQNGELLSTDIAVEAMIQFAKLHVKEALKQASEKAGMIWATTDFYDDRKIIHKPSILNAYPLDNIK